MTSDHKTQPALCGILADDIFREIGPVPESVLAKIRKSERFAPGSSILRNGDKPATICILRSGIARVLLDSGCSHDQKSRMAETGEIFGLTECIADSEITDSVQAVSECEFEVFRCRDLIDFLEAEPILCLRLTRAIGNSIGKPSSK